MEMNCGARKSKKVNPARNFDIYYDSTLCFSSSKDYAREVDKAVSAAASFVVRPCYGSMFSDTRRRLQLQVCYPTPPPLPPPSVATPTLQSLQVLGPRRPLFFKQPIQKPRSSASLQIKMAQPAPSAEPAEREQIATACHKSTQTDYRDSHTQTEPWSHDVIARPTLHLLRLGWLHLDEKKPIGKVEVTQLERHWQKQAWDEVLTQMTQTDITHAMAANDTSARDADVEADNNLRLLLAARRLSLALSEKSAALQGRLARFAARLSDRQAATVAYWKHQLCRSLRKLNMQQRGVDLKYKSRLSRDVLTELVDKASELNAPPLRFGHQPHSRNLIHCTGLEMAEKKMVESRETTSGFDFEIHSKPKMTSCNRTALAHQQHGVATSTQEPEDCPRLALRKLRENYYVETPPEDNSGDDPLEENQQQSLLLARAIRGTAAESASSQGGQRDSSRICF